MEKLRNELRDVTEVNRKLKNLSSIKCNLNKKFKYGRIMEKEYNERMEEINSLTIKCQKLKDEYSEGSRRKSYLELNEEEISKLSLDELERGIRSIDSIKCRDYDKADMCEDQKEIFKKYKKDNSNKNKGLIEVKKIEEVLRVLDSNNIEDVEIVKNMLNELIK